MAPKTPLVESEAAESADLADFASQKAVKRVLIVGVSSYIGSSLAVGLRDEFDVIGTYYKHKTRIEGIPAIELDTLSATKVFEVVKKFQPEAVIFCPGQQDIDKVQADVDEADNLHTKAAALYFKMPVANFHFIYFSSAQVFGNASNDNQMPPFVETDEPAPINAYAQTKLQGESLVSSQSRFNHILRLSDVYGEPFGSGTVKQTRKTWIEAVRAQLEAGQKITLPDDIYRSPLYIGDLVRGMREYLKKVTPEKSLHNMGSKDMLSRYAFVKLLAENLGYDSSLVLKSQPDFEASGKTPRPRNCALSSQKFENDFGYQFQTCEQAIRELAERLRFGFTRTWN